MVATVKPGRLQRFFLQEDLNFLLTNRLPRRYATLFMGWFSQIEQPLVRDLSIATWKLFADDLQLDEAESQTFRTLRELFIRKLKRGARTIDADVSVLTSPCDAIVGACGRVTGKQALQAKGFAYPLLDLLGNHERVARHEDGWYVTLRLKSDFYHRFHAPCDGQLRHVTYISGDTWNVNPIALKRVEQLFCKNERAVLDLETPMRDVALTLVPVAAILVASMRIHGLPETLDLRYRGPNEIPCNVAFQKGDELGYFQSGSTIVVFSSGNVSLAPNIHEGARIRMGEPLLHHLTTNG